MLCSKIYDHSHSNNTLPFEYGMKVTFLTANAQVSNCRISDAKTVPITILIYCQYDPKY